MCINKRPSSTGGSGSTSSTRRTGRPGGTCRASSTCCAGSACCTGGSGRAAGRASRPSRAGRASGALHGGSRQGALHLRFQEELVLNGGLQHATYAFIGSQNIADCGGRAAEPRDSAQNILQFLAFGVKNMAQAEFLHGDGGEDLVDRILPLDGRVDIGKTWHRHRDVSPFKLWVQARACQNASIAQEGLPGEAPTAHHMPWASVRFRRHRTVSAT